MHEKFFLLAGEISRLQQSPCVMNLHSAAAPADIPRRELVEQSVRFFEWAKEWCAEHAPGVQLMAELQYRQEPHESLWRIGDEYEELLEVVERSGVGACWDFGHAAMNAKRYGLGLYPPESLLEKFEHVHCHDVNGEDHQPLVFGGAPWKQYLQQLAESGFEGTIILEIPPQNFLKHDGIIDLEFSAKALRQHVSECLAARSK